MEDVFKSEKIISDNIAVIPFVEKDLKAYFEREGFEYKREEKSDIITIFVKKGGLLTEAFGMHSALKIQIIPTVTGKVKFVAGIGFWEHQGRATAMSMLVTSAALGTQIWGAVQQAHLDDKALEIAELAVKKYRDTTEHIEYTYCTKCGRKIEVGKECDHKCEHD